MTKSLNCACKNNGWLDKVHGRTIIQCFTMSFEHWLLIIGLLACTVAPSQQTTFQICEHKGRTLRCPAGTKLNILAALYGRKSTRICRFGSWGVTNCGKSSSFTKAKQICNGKSSCTLRASNSVFGDPCWGVTKYLDVTYECKGPGYVVPKVSVASSGSRIWMKCEFTPTGDATQVYEVTWFSSVDGKDVQLAQRILRDRRHITYLQNTEILRTLRIGYTVFVRLRTWLPSQGKTSATVRTSNRYYLGVKLSPVTLSISESGSPVALKVTPTVPILCEDESTNCSVAVRIVQSHPDILISSCTLVFKASTTIPISQTVTVFAKRGFVDYGSVKVVITAVAQYHPAPSSTGDWYEPTNPGAVQVTTRSVSAGQCTSSGDPHLRTFDNTFFNHYQVGDYTLVKSTSRRFEVHVRTHRCARVSCNCGVAVREGDDVLVVDMCRNYFSPQPRYASNQEPVRGTYIERSSNGKTFILKFASGAVVKFVAKHWFGSNYYADVTVQVPPDDFKHTEGLCGVFDKKKSNDMAARDGRVWKHCRGQACPEFTESWKLSSRESLFYFNPTHKQLTCQPSLQRSHCVCGRNTTICNIPVAPPLLKRATRGFTKLVFAGQAECDKLRPKPGPGVTEPGVVEPIQPCITLPTCKGCIYPYVPPTTKPYLPTWPTEDGLEKTDAQKICNDGIKKTQLFKVCKKYVDGAIIAGFLDQCVTDIQILDTKGIQAAIQAATDAFKETCEDHATRNPDNWKKNENGTMEPPTDCIDVSCPNQCSDNGVCRKGSCVCNEGYLTEDCSVKKGQKPELTTIKNAVCKTDNDTDCTSVTIVSKGLIPGNIHCYFSVAGNSPTKTAAVLISFSEVRCQLPVATCGNGNAGFAHTSYSVRLGNGDAISENELPYRIINSKCLTCNGSNCVQETGVCIVNGCCYGNEEADPDDRNCSYCDTKINNTEFSRRSTADCKVHPCDLNNGGCIDTCKKVGEKALCACTTSGTELGMDGKSCKNVHPCDLNNGGCADTCKKVEEKALCVCNVSGTFLGKDGKSCVVTSLVKGSYDKIDLHLSISQTHYPVVRNAPRLLVQLEMNPRLEGNSFVPENCYATTTIDRFDPYRFYFLRNRFPCMNSYRQHLLTMRSFKFSVSPSAILKHHRGLTYVHCLSAICPPNSPRCYFEDKDDRDDTQPRYADITTRQLVHSVGVIELY